ncbi:MAG: cob(I)yrinic acid a,c-diamide adenosyltransferase [Deferribacteraceae bacterium]|jgi:cob(I)alamin adenosyltransferase|nr:cob(I)yrinic acid a,c-diamide adenosyltransferase [Deferribacteraceae bacterium]
MSLTKRTGDSGTTTIFTNDTVRKDHPVIEALGAYEELISRLGVAKLHIDRFSRTIERFQRSLVQIMGVLSSLGRVDCHDIEKEAHFLDVLVEEYDRDIGDRLTENVIPGEDMPSAELHLARAACRQFERRVVALQSLITLDSNILKYVNRLSDVIYLMAVISSESAHKDEEKFD